jgi:hypothetical protein
MSAPSCEGHEPGDPLEPLLHGRAIRRSVRLPFHVGEQQFTGGGGHGATARLSPDPGGLGKSSCETQVPAGLEPAGTAVLTGRLRTRSQGRAALRSIMDD